MPQKDPTHNLNALLLGTGEFSFSLGATSLATALLLGYRDIGNIKAFTPSQEKTEQVHKGSYRGKLIKDRTVTSEESIVYTLQCEEWDKDKLKMFFRGAAGTGHTQSAQAAAIVDTFAFTSPIPAVAGNWYQLTTGAAHLMRLTSVNLLTSGTGIAVTSDQTTDQFTATAHGLANGTPVVLRNGTAPTGLSLNTVYYVVSTATNTFQLALTVGGTAINFTVNGSGNSVFTALIEGTDFDVDLVLGRIKFRAAQTATITPTVTAPAITATDATYLYGILPLQGVRFEGYGRLVCFDQNTNKVIYDHRDFSCEVMVESTGAIDGTNWSELTIKVIVDSEAPGVVMARES